MKKKLVPGKSRRKKRAVQTEANVEMNKKKALVYNADVTKHNKKMGLNQIIKSMFSEEKKKGKPVVNLKNLSKKEKHAFMRSLRDTLILGAYKDGV